MIPFLHSVASSLYETHGNKMHRLAVVFPNRRQAAYCLHYLQQVATPPCFLPVTYTIEELVAASTSLTIADNLSQGFYLYKAYKSVCLEMGDDEVQIPSFDSFFSIGETLIKDFRDLDAYVTNVEEVCSLLYEIETIDKSFDQLTEEQKSFLRQFWLGARDKSAIQEKFLKLWQRLPAIYNHFHALLETDGKTTLGMAYRKMAGTDCQMSNFRENWDHMAFVGFNAFNTSEEIFIKRWQDAGYASVWFDADSWYLDDKKQEAGDFLRRNINQKGLLNAFPVSNDISNKQTAIDIYAVEGQHLQAKTISTWLERLFPFHDKHIGIILADESLLLPALQSLPRGLERLNVTMGFPLKQSPVYDLVKLYLDIQVDLRQHKFQTVEHHLVSRWLQHPLCSWDEKMIARLRKKMITEQLFRVPANELNKHDEASSIMFSHTMAELEIFHHLMRLCEISTQHEASLSDALTGGLLTATHDVLQQLYPLFSQLQPVPSFSFMTSILMKQLGTITVPFEGEPLVGVQIMGLLETRGIDFDHILLLGAGEGNLPRIKPPESFLPHNIRRAFGMTVPEHQHAIFAYVFYRLLQRSESLAIAYNTLISDSSTGEISRFVQQLQFESSIPFNKTTWSLPVSTQPSPPIIIEKNESINKILNTYLYGTNSLSPSGINTYLTCRLKFYFRYVARLKEPEQLEEAIEARQVGEVVHKLMEILYQPYLGKTVEAKDITILQRQVVELAPEAFKVAWYKSSGNKPFNFTGELLVIKEVVIEFARILLQNDLANAPFKLVDLEIKMNEPFTFSMDGKTAQVTLSGYADRVDEKNGIYRMVDYKTGGDKPDFKNAAGLFGRDMPGINKGALQTLLYSWLFSKANPGKPQFEPALLIARQMNTTQDFSGHLLEKETREQVNAGNISHYLKTVESGLQDLFRELFASDTVFDQTTRLDNCKYCDYSGICGRG